MTICVDRSNRKGWAHLVSDLVGEPGRRELAAFGIKIGLARRLHRDGTYAEHYDIREEEILRAIDEGARLISRRKLAYILRRKKGTKSVFRLEGFGGPQSGRW